MGGPMDHAEHLRRAQQAFGDDVASPPALTLRGANAVDGYDEPDPYHEAADAPTDEYLERFAFWAMPYLDARSWRHYLPRLIEYALAHPRDPHMVTEALVRSLSPPDRVSPRLATLTPEQTTVIVDLLKLIVNRLSNSHGVALACIWLTHHSRLHRLSNQRRRTSFLEAEFSSSHATEVCWSDVFRKVGNPCTLSPRRARTSRTAALVRQAASRSGSAPRGPGC